MRSVIGDIRDLRGLSKIFDAFKPEIVIHMAAQALVLESYKNPVYTYETNVMGTLNVLECVRNSDCVRSFLNVTTDKVYLNRERPEGYREDDQLNGLDPYANSKSCSELVTSSYRNSFLEGSDAAVSTARSGNVIGGGDFAENRLIPDCYRAAANGEVIQVRNSRSVRPYQHVLDTLAAYLLIAQRQHEEPKFAGSYNIGPDESECKNNAELVTMFCDAWGSGQSWEHIKIDAPHESGMLRLDCRKIWRTLGWQPKWTIDGAVAKSVEWYCAFVDGGGNMIERQIGEFCDG
jgi:CDP-glucose 4,6-dehydratase